LETEPLDLAAELCNYRRMARKEPILEFKLSSPQSFHCSACGNGPDEGAFVITGEVKDLISAFRSHVQDFHSKGEDFNQAAFRVVRESTKG
jgi:hypothetical protein